MVREQMEEKLPNFLRYDLETSISVSDIKFDRNQGGGKGGFMQNV